MSTDFKKTCKYLIPQSKKCLKEAIRLNNIAISVLPPHMIVLYNKVADVYPKNNFEISQVDVSPEFGDNYFCCQHIQKWINNHSANNTFYTWESKYQDQFKLVAISDKRNIDANLFIKAKRLSVISQILNISKIIDISIWLAPHTKLFPKNTYQPITKSHINSGSTNGVTISIWRQEESDKVLVHEAIHVAKAHGHGVDQNERMMARFRVSANSMLRPAEAFTEWLAISFHLCLCCQEKNIAVNALSQMYVNEYLFGLVQTAKLLTHFGFTNWEEFIKRTESNAEINQETDAISYICIKTAMLNTSDYWFKKKQKKQENWMYCCNTDDLFEWIDYAINDETHIQNVNNAIRNVKKTPGANLRMSALEFSH